jgi:hypothetical protein
MNAKNRMLTSSRSVLFAWAALITLFFSGCGSRLETSDLVGKFQAEYPFGTETLTLNSDGKYVQEFVELGNTNVANVHGAWHYDSAHRELELENPLVINYDPNQTPKQRAVQVSGTGLARVQSKSRLSINEDLGYYYQRIPEQ